jgi:SAM-dependent methyltransferase
MDKATIRERERDEIARSASEAIRMGSSGLRIDDNEILRYANPNPNTCFPNEYAFYLLGDVHGKTVLDYGCGDGELTVLLASRRARVLAIDISEAAIQRLQQRLVVNNIASGIEFFVGSGHALPLPDESVDVVFGAAILHHLDLSLAAPEVRRVLRPGGRAIFREPVRNSKLIQRLRKMIPYQGPDVSPHERPLLDSELEEFARGFSNFTSRAFMLPFVSVARVVPFLRWLAIPLWRMDAKLLRRFPSLCYYAGIRVMMLVK